MDKYGTYLIDLNKFARFMNSFKSYFKIINTARVKGLFSANPGSKTRYRYYIACIRVLS